MDDPTTTTTTTTTATATATAQLSMKDALAKVRALHTSKLSNQKQAAALLIAVESTINDQNPNATDTPAAYFATLMTFLEQQNGQKNAEETRAAILYILNIVFSYLPVSILRARFTDIVGIFGSVLENDKDSAPTIRAVVGCIEYLLVAQDTNSWTTQIAKRLFQTLLQLCIDPRPKVRKRAQDAARRLLLSPPPPALRHPSSNMTAEFCLRVLRETTKTDSQSGLHILALVRIIVSSWPEDSIPALCEELLRLPKLNNSFLSVSAFTVFETMFDKTAASLEEGRIEELLVALTELKPHHNDAQLTIPWLEIVNKGYVAYASNNQVRCAEAFPGVFAMVFPGLQSSDKAVIAATANCLARLVSVCITDAMIVEAVGAFAKRFGEKPKKGPKRTPLETMIYACEQGLGYRFKAGWGGVLQILRALYERLDRRSSPLLNNVLSTLAELRMDLQDLEDAEYKVAIDATLAAAVRAMRPDAFLQVLPLNVDRERIANSPGRAYLLPLIKDAHLKNCELAYFCDTLLPLSDALREKAALCSSDGRAIQGKIYETLAQQIWALFPGFCHLPTDLPKSFSFTFAEKIANQLYAEPELRSVVCQGLQLLVDKATFVKNSLEATAEEKEMRDADLKHLSKFATNLLAVFFNVFSQTPATFRGYILDVIKAYLSVASQADITSTFSKVGTLLTQALATPTPSTNDPTAPPPPAHTMLDLSLAMMPYLDITSASTLYQVATNLIVSKSAEEDPSLQKKAYKALRGMADVGSLKKGVLEANIEDLQKRLIDGTELTTASAKKDRLLLFVQVVPLLPSSDLSFIPSVLSEAVVSTKEVNERARNVAYELLVAMGNRMAVPGGQIVQSNIPEMANEQAESSGAQLQQTTVPASITEYFTMVVAGLAGSTAHMISATITALSRLLFEFKEMCKPELINELINTVHLFVMGTNREVVKAALGFVKVTTVSMNTDILETHLPQIVTGILQWSQEHKSHFKAKVRHIFERLIRRVGYEAVERHIPEEHRKLIINIKKRRERAKRKKNAADKEENDSDDEVEEFADGKGKRPMPSFGNAYEDALYGSESELDDDEEDEEMEEPVPQKGKKGANKKKTTENWIKEDGDGPLDFLDRRVVSRVTSTNPSARRLNRPDGTSAFTSSSDGRLVIDDSEAEGEENNEGMDIDQEDESNEAENHYRDSVASKDGFTRTPQNRIKFNNKRRRDDDPMDIDPKAKGGKKTKNAPPPKQERIGQAYKAKRAQGDVKKANMPDPYAYVPLNPKSLKKRGAPGAKTSIMATQKNRRK